MQDVVDHVLLALIIHAAYLGVSWQGNAVLDHTVHTNFHCDWISAISMGFGVLPLCFAADINAYWIGVINAIAWGMMTVAF